VVLAETRTQPHTRHLFEAELRSVGRATHLRLNVFPDGGVARLRAWGEPEVLADARTAALQRLNTMPRAEAVTTLRSFCGSLRWAEKMADARPFEDVGALLRIADRAFWSLSAQDWLEAFSAHPRIGEKKAGDDQHSTWARQEQGGVAAAGKETLALLASLNEEYFARHGFVFLICATGRSAEEMVVALQQRLGASREKEIRTAAEEQAKILRLRIEKWLGGT
jgi:allantoicase